MRLTRRWYLVAACIAAFAITFAIGRSMLFPDARLVSRENERARSSRDKSIGDRLAPSSDAHKDRRLRNPTWARVHIAAATDQEAAMLQYPREFIDLRNAVTRQVGDQYGMALRACGRQVSAMTICRERFVIAVEDVIVHVIEHRTLYCHAEAPEDEALATSCMAAIKDVDDNELPLNSGIFQSYDGDMDIDFTWYPQPLHVSPENISDAAS